MSEDRLNQEQFVSMRDDIADIKSSMGKIAEALTRLAVLEEKHTSVAQATNKILERIERIERTQHESEISKETFSRLFTAIETGQTQLNALQLNYATDKAKQEGVVKTIKALWFVVGGLVLWAGSRLFMMAVASPAAIQMVP